MKKFDNKFTPPFRVGRKQGKAVLDSKGLEVIFFNNSEEQAQLYCDYLNRSQDLQYVRETLEWVADNMECRDPKMHETFFNLYANSFNLLSDEL